MLVAKNKKRIKVTIIVTTIALILLSLPVIYVYAFDGNIFGWQKNNSSRQPASIDYDKPTKDQIKAGNDAKSDVNNPTVDSPKGDNGGTQNPVLPSGKYGAIVTIINAGTVDNDRNVNIRASVNTIDTDGECTLNVLSQAGTVVETQTAKTQAQSSYSSCLGFTFSKSNLPAGTYTTKIIYVSKTHEGSASANFKL